MDSPSWHARIDRGGAVAGSGFLVSDRHVLTCAHVVGQEDAAEIVFTGVPGLEPVRATVAVRGAWSGRNQDPGDVAVLELGRPVRIAPAAFAGLDEPHRMPTPKLVAYGFPAGYGEEGVQSELRATSRQLIGNEWSQLELWAGHGQEPSYGFSGSAVMLENGAVVGMVSAHDETVRNGRMIPAQVLARHWPPVADLIPTPGYPAEEKRRLRELIELTARAPEPGYAVDRLLQAAIAPLGVDVPAHSVNNLWQAVWYLLSETLPRPASLPLAELAVRLADLVEDSSLGRDLRAWSLAHRGTHGHAAGAVSPPPPPPLTPPPSVPPLHATAPHLPPQPPAPAGVRAPARPWSPILVAIRHSGADRNAVLAEVAAYRDGHRLLVGEKRLLRAQVRDWALDRVDEAFGEIDSEGRELIAFALPRGWINQPVDQWTQRKGIRTPLGCRSPVVVMDQDRRSSDLLQFKLRKMWDVLDRQEGCAVHPVHCDSAQRPERLSVQLQEVHGPVGMARPPKSARDKELHRAVLDAPSPIVLWPRTGCPGRRGAGQCALDCRRDGFLDTLAEQLAQLPPTELPERVLELRRRAFLHEGPEPHWADGLSLVWEDPRWFPEARRLNDSPVG
ncbi:trypsin-like peptidase domain-containing protein [Streptomyces sp. NPDC002870]|uniref:VMAP-C domain-containing protein n=1 Tax=Streptomyces sp. NPDC002870 TaxID=3364666 RepID=UPI0036739651